MTQGCSDRCGDGLDFKFLGLARSPASGRKTSYLSGCQQHGRCPNSAQKTWKYVFYSTNKHRILIPYLYIYTHILCLFHQPHITSRGSTWRRRPTHVQSIRETTPQIWAPPWTQTAPKTFYPDPTGMCSNMFMRMWTCVFYAGFI